MTMKKKTNGRAHALLVLGLSLGLTMPVDAQSAASGKDVKETKEALMSARANGTFEVKVQPLPEDIKVEGVPVGRLSIDKQFKGGLEGTSRGEMMTTDTSVQGSAGYVAVERVKGTLDGRGGTFTLLHHGTMKHGGDFRLIVTVVPDSGTGPLAGLAGTMTIVIADGKHSYQFDYTLPDTP